MAEIDLGKIGITPQGEWSNNTNYEELSLVTRLGQAYVSIRSTAGKAPESSEEDWMLIGARGESLYQMMVRTGRFIGTEDEFLQQYQDTLDACIEATSASTEQMSQYASAFSDIIDNVNEKIAQIDNIEQQHDAKERERQTNESRRVSAENARVTAENNRSANEIERISVENTRKDSESSRVSAENARVAAEQIRTEAEASRNSQYAQAESSRNTSYSESEASRDTSYQTAEGSATSPATEASRWGKYNAEEARRQAAMSTIENESQRLNNLSSRVDRNDATLGHYTARPDINLTSIEVGKAISKDGVKVSKSGWAIAKFTAVKGNEYLFKAGITDGNVCIFAEEITKEETRSIDYTYTYDENGRVSTAKATYGGQTHSYTYTYELSEEGAVVSETITDDQTQAIILALPYQYRTAVGTYQPMTILNAEDELPQDGYCRLVSHFQNDTALTVVVSYSVDDADLTIKVLRDGFTASICTQLSNLAKRIANALDYVTNVDEQQQTLRADVNGLLADVKTREDFAEIPLLCGQPMTLFGAGTPQEAIVPTNWIQFLDGGYNWNGKPSALGQVYINTSVTSGGRYTAVRDGAYGLKWINS